jgi:hypothetical protein
MNLFCSAGAGGLEPRDHPPPTTLEQCGANTEGQRGLPRNQITQAHLESAQTIMNHRLDKIELHNCLHGCRANRGTGTPVIETKLAQQLSYLELKPFFGVFLDLKKVSDLMDNAAL